MFSIGTLSAVGELDVKSNATTITVSWIAPFSLDVTDVDPDIWYSVLIHNVTDSDRPTAINCTDCTNITETCYTFSPDHLSLSHKYNFTVIPFNGAGQGESSHNITGSSKNPADFISCGELSVFNVFSPVDSGGVVSSKIDITVTTTPVATASDATASDATASDTPCPSSSSNQKGISVIIIFDEYMLLVANML